MTTPEAISIVEKTLGGKINPGLVAMINEHGGKATGIPGTDVFFAERISGSGENGEPVVHRENPRSISPPTGLRRQG